MRRKGDLVKKENLIPVKFIVIFIFLAVSILVIGYYSYREDEKQYRIEVERELTIISEMKVTELAQWRRERIGDSEIISNNALFSDLVRRYLRNQQDSKAEQQLQEWIDQYPKNRNYDQVRLIDTHGVTRMSSPVERSPASAAITNRIAEVLQSGQITIVDLYRHDHDRQIYLSILIPVRHVSTGTQPIGVIALRVDPAKYLYPFILSWPTPHETAETLLFRRDGNDVLYLNELKFRKDSALNLRIPLERTDVPAVKAVLGQTGIVKGIDYRGEQVLASVKNVHDSPWFLESRMDLSEAYSPARRLFWMTIGLVAVLIFSIGVSLGFVWRQQNIFYYRERYESAELLRESEERFRSLFEKVHVVALIINPEDGSIMDANTSAVSFYGWSLDELRTKKISDINTLSPDALQKEMEAARTELRSYFLFQHRRADGSVRDVEVYSGPIQVKGKTLLYSIIHDITERRQAEEKIWQVMNEQQIILQNAPIGISFIRNRRFIWTNPYVENIFGYEFHELWGQSTRVLYVSQDDYVTTGEAAYAHIVTGENYSTELEMVKKQGDPFWVSLIGQAVNPNNLADGSIWMFQDISERRQSEDALREKTLQLEELTHNLEKRVEEEIAIRRKNEQILIQQAKLAAMGEMLGAIAHQWRQPLNTLGMCVQNINDSYIHGDLNRFYLEKTVQKSMDQIHHMSKTIDDFRNFFLPDKEISEFDSMAAVGDVLMLISAQLMSSDIAFRLTCHTHARTFDHVGDIMACPEKTVEGYRNEFEHVILNLISNARDAITAKRGAADEGPSIRGLITFDFFNRDNHVIIEVGDNGTGIPEAIIPRIFEPYFTIKEQTKGTGIGLYMSKIIIEDHMKGSLTARNGQEGAIFTIVLRQEKAVLS